MSNTLDTSELVGELSLKENQNLKEDNISMKQEATSINKQNLNGQISKLFTKQSNFGKDQAEPRILHSKKLENKSSNPNLLEQIKGNQKVGQHNVSLTRKKYTAFPANSAQSLLLLKKLKTKRNFSIAYNNDKLSKEEQQIIEKITGNQQQQSLSTLIFQEMIQKNYKSLQQLSSNHKQNNKSQGDFNYCLDGREIQIPKSSSHKKWLNMFDGNVAPVALDATGTYKLCCQEEPNSGIESSQRKN